MTTAIILAGGMGTRLRHAVPDLPKPMAPISGRPFLEHQMDYWINQGVKEFVISVGYLKEVIMDHFGMSYRSTPLKYAIENEPLGTGGGLLLAAQGHKGPILVLNGDTFFEVDLSELLKFHIAHSSDWTFSLFRTDEVGRYMGMEVRPDGSISALKTGTAKPGRLANGGVYLINPSILTRTDLLPDINISLEDELLPSFVTQGCKLYGLEFVKKFIDIGVPYDYFRADQFLSHNQKNVC